MPFKKVEIKLSTKVTKRILKAMNGYYKMRSNTVVQFRMACVTYICMDGFVKTINALQ